MHGDMSLGRVNQKQRTRSAILQAANDLVTSGREVTMPDVARAALVSEATAYRYFPNLAALLHEAMAKQPPDSDEALGSADVADPVDRVAIATEYLLRHVMSREAAVRAMIAATINRPDGPVRRPNMRVDLIDAVLAPIAEPPGAIDAAALAKLKVDLSVVVSAEALFSLLDLQQLEPEAAIASIVRIAMTLTRAALPGSGAAAAATEES